jgi:hypothetical protein
MLSYLQLPYQMTYLQYLLEQGEGKDSEEIFRKGKKGNPGCTGILLVLLSILHGILHGILLGILSC